MKSTVMWDPCRWETAKRSRIEEARVQLLSGDARRAVFAPLDDGALRSEAVVRVC